MPKLAFKADTATGTMPSVVEARIATIAGGVAGGGHTHTATQVSDSTTIGRQILTAADASAVRSAISAPTTTDVTNAVVTATGRAVAFSIALGG